MFARIELGMRPEFSDPAATAFLRRIELAHPEIRRKIRWARTLDIHWLDLPTSREESITAITEVFWDRVLQWLITGNLIPSAAGKHGSMLDIMEAAPCRPGKFWALERRFRPGVTDHVARTSLEAFEIVGNKKIPAARAASGGLVLLEGPELDEDLLAVIARGIFCNELIETWTILSEQELCKSDRFHQERIKRDLPVVPVRGQDKVDTIKLDASDEELVALSRRKLWALSLEELKTIHGYFSNENQKRRRVSLGLGEPTDVEMEILAQTWSEHCKHKIFNAQIRYRDTSANAATSANTATSTTTSTRPTQPVLPGPQVPKVIDGLFKETIVNTTAQLQKPWLLSVFKDNAGIVAFDDEDAFCMKVETHNTPSALDPYGGALTGIVGVQRDILGCGLGAKPVFNTDVFCFAHPDYSKEVPERLLHPRRILDGVRRGVEHGGNQSGVPTINGAMVFDDRYLGKPLIYCGTGGLMPRTSAERRTEIKEIKPGDRICMVGGRVGKDGIHGATYSSLALDDVSPASAVQLGDPIVQKRLSDFLLEARDAGLYRGLTDNGAGGLSSSVGELARISGGARLDLEKVKTKYPGLRPHELVVSESEERMTVAVPPEKLELFLALAERRGVEVSDLGDFTDVGSFDVFFGRKMVASLELEFLHNGLPRMELNAEWTGSVSGSLLSQTSVPVSEQFEREAPKVLLEMLARPNIASKEWLIRQYDHEVQGMSVIKPLHTSSTGTQAALSGPNDAGVILPKPTSSAGIAVGCGINPKLSDLDPYLMAQAAVDEAVRNVLSVGADFGKPESFLALVDNFCCSDPVGDPAKTAAVVRACYGLRDAALALETPLISGKDSMKNDFHGKLGGQRISISVPPTLLVTAVARVGQIQRALTADFKARGDLIYLLGGSRFGLLGSELHSMRAEKSGQGLPTSLAQGAVLRVGLPDWDEAKRIYQWIGGATGKEHVKLRSLHDVSEGGLLVAVAESILARGLGASVVVPEECESWEFCFGEGFHSFVASVAEADASLLEAEWTSLQVPFKKIGVVTTGDKFLVRGSGPDAKTWGVDLRSIRTVWRKEGYWE